MSIENASPEGQQFTPSPIDPGTDPEYLAARRSILGPSADITHPEFGRDNTPAETFVFRSEVKCPSKFSIVTTPIVHDSSGNELDADTLKLADFSDGLQTDEPAQDWIEVAETD